MQAAGSAGQRYPSGPGPHAISVSADAGKNIFRLPSCHRTTYGGRAALPDQHPVTRHRPHDSPRQRAPPTMLGVSSPSA
jgi:hypothetical protein